MSNHGVSGRGRKFPRSEMRAPCSTFSSSAVLLPPTLLRVLGGDEVYTRYRRGLVLGIESWTFFLARTGTRLWTNTDNKCDLVHQAAQPYIHMYLAVFFLPLPLCIWLS